MAGVVSSIPSGGNFIFADFETPRCQFCTKMPEMSDLCYLGKARLLRKIIGFSSKTTKLTTVPIRAYEGKTKRIQQKKSMRLGIEPWTSFDLL